MTPLSRAGRAGSVIALALVLTAIVPAMHAGAAITAGDAPAIAKAITAGEPTVGAAGNFVTGAAFVAKPPTGAPDATSNTPLPASPPNTNPASFPSNGANYGILSTGTATIAGDANTSTSSGADDAGGNIKGNTDFDVSILRIDMTVPSTANCLSLDFQFFSEEFPEYKGSQFNDAFIAELDNNNWTTSGSTITAPNNFAFDQDHNVISINSLGETRVTAANSAGTTYDGGTEPLVATTPITSGGHSLYLSIFDQADHAFDSAAFVDDLTVGNALTGGCTPGARREISNTALTTVGADGTGTFTTPTAITSAPLADIRLNALAQQTPATANAPFGKTPFGKTPFGKTPFGKTPFGKTPFGKTPFGKTPFGKTPFGKTPFGKTPFGKTPLSEVGLLRPGGWTQVLADSCDFKAYTPQQVYLYQLFGDSCASPQDSNPATFPEMSDGSPDQITLDQLIIAGTTLADAPLLGVLMGNVTWNQVGRPAGTWSGELAALPDCATVDPTKTILEGAAQGCPLDLTTLPIRNVGDLGTNKPSTLFWDVTAGDVNVRGSAVGDITLGQIGAPTYGPFIDCTKLTGGCTPATTLRQVDQANAWTVNGTGDGMRFSDIGSALNSLSLSDIVIAFTDPSGYPYEDAALASMGLDRLGTPPTNFVTYRLTFGVRCSDSQGLFARLYLPSSFQYVSGSTHISDAGAFASTADPTMSEGTATWAISPGAGGICPSGTVGTDNVTMTFTAMPGFETGTFTSDASVGTSTVPSVSVSGAAPVHVVESFEPAGPDNSSNATMINPNSIVVGQLSTSNDADYFKFDVQPGEQVTVSLSHLSRNYQLVLYAPPGSDQAQSLRPSTTPIPVPVGTQPLPDAGAQGSSSLLPPALQDVHLETGSSVGPVAGISDFTGNDQEFVSTTAVAGTSGSHTYVAQVSTGNGEHGSEPYVLVVRDSQPLTPTSCAAQPFTHATAGDTPKLVGGAGPLTGIGSSVNTLFLLDQTRLNDAYGATSGTTVLASLVTLLTSPNNGGVNGVIVNLDAYPTVDDANYAWDQDPCNPSKMNDVVRSINNVVDGLKVAGTGPGQNDNLANLKNIVVVGDGSIIPHGALPDGTFDGNENGFVGDTIFGGNSNAMTGAFAGSFFLSDAPYAALTPLSVAGQLVYVPQVALGRLGGAASTITAEINQYVLAQGKADSRAVNTDPRLAMEADYDFLTDMGAAQTASLIAQVGSGNVHRLTGPSWTRAQLAAELDGTSFTPNRVPDLILPNAHYDQSRLLPSAPNTAGSYTPADLYTTADLPSSLALRIFATIGCHAALDFPDAIGGATPTAADAARLADWEQVLQNKGIAAAIGNLGFGLGDKATIALGERIMADFTAGLDGSMTVGQSMVAAQRNYFGSSASFTPYDLKALQEVVVWGMPMYSVPGTGGGPGGGGGPATNVSSGISGVNAQQVAVSGSFDKKTTSDGRAYFANGTQVQVTHPYPIMPKFTQDLTPPENNEVAHGAIPISWNLNNVTVDSGFATNGYAFANATYDSSAEGSPAAHTNYPTTFSQIGTWYDAAGKAHQQLVVVPAQFRSGTAGSPQFGTFRELPGNYLVFYSTDTSDFVGPEFQQVVVTDNLNGTATIDVTVTGASRVVAQALKGSTPGTYQEIELQQDTGDSTHWSAPAKDATNADFVPSEVTVFAVDNHGNTSTANNGGPGFVSQPPQPGSVKVKLTGPSTGGFFTGTVTASSNPSGYKVNVDGGTKAASVDTSTEGTHSANAFAKDDSTVLDSRSFTIDTTPPTATIVVPAPPAIPAGGSTPQIPIYAKNEVVLSRFTCADNGSGIGSCLGKSDLDPSASPGNPSGAPVNTSQLGIHTFTVTATDNAGHAVTTPPRQYEVVQFNGFFTPVDNPPLVNTAKAGANIPVKYQLQRLVNGSLVGVADTYAFVSITAYQGTGSACSGSADAIEITSGSSGLQYLGNGNWQFNWSTLKSYSGKCTTMSLNLWDAAPGGRSVAIAYFLFK